MKTFEVTSGALAVSDPCYTPGIWCLGYLENVKNGTWHFDVVRGDEDRVAELRVWHSDLSSFPDPEKSDLLESDITVGVDSGQAGFFDKEFFDQTPRGDYHDKTSFYGMACTLTHDWALDAKLRHGEPIGEDEFYFTAGVLMDRAVVSSSGYGDGAYSCFYQVEEQSGKIDAALIRFLWDDEDEDEDEEFDGMGNPLDGRPRLPEEAA